MSKLMKGHDYIGDTISIEYEEREEPKSRRKIPKKRGRKGELYHEIDEEDSLR
jgi:hypothetical protein